MSEPESKLPPNDFTAWTLIRLALSSNPSLSQQVGLKEVNLNFPQPDWWILRVLVWCWMSFFYSLSWLIQYNISIIIKTTLLSFLFICRGLTMLTEWNEGGWAFAKLIGHFSIITAIQYIFIATILPIELYLLRESFAATLPALNIFIEAYHKSSLMDVISAIKEAKSIIE